MRHLPRDCAGSTRPPAPKCSALGIEELRLDAVFDLTSQPEEWQELGDVFAVFLQIVEWQSDDVLQIPLSATFRNEGGWAVFVADGTITR